MFCGGTIGLFVGQKITSTNSQQNICQPASAQDIEIFYSQTVGVSEEQKKKLLEIEQNYQRQKTVYMQKMQSANNKLADTLEAKGYEAPEVAAIVMEIHSAMGMLQHLSLKHLANLETVLTQKQSIILKKHAVQRLRQN